MRTRKPWIRYSDAELKWIEKNCKMTRAALHAAFVKKFDRSDVSRDNLKALCTRKGWKTGRDGRYLPGSVPANKGKKMPYNANSAATQFKKGQMPKNMKFIGHERITKDGYVEISVRERNPHTGADRRYVQKHRHLWQQKHGPVPEGHALKCLDGDKTNCDPSNWKCVPRSMLPRLNGKGTKGRKYDQAPAELKPSILATATLEQAIADLEKSEIE